MEKFLKQNILDELYEMRGDEFEDNILKEMAKQNKELSSLDIEGNLTKKIKQAISNKKLQEKILELLNKYELEVVNENEFWNKMYYKLGVYDCVEMKKILQTEDKNENIRIETTFFDEYSDDFMDYLEKNRMKILKGNTEYKKLTERIEKIKVANPNVRTFMEDKEAVELTDVELNAVLDILEVEDDIDTIEMKENFKLGAREMIIFLKQMRLL
ncbi:MAG: hypothetical protein UIT70_02825 [Clostridia bacterium]|nr:hypothetical protein [Clostridia bacterium]